MTLLEWINIANICKPAALKHVDNILSLEYLEADAV